MPAKIISVVNQKGGCGKTTISMHLAGTLGRRGFKVMVVDADPQGTATRWSSSADEATPFPAAVIGLSAAGEKVHREVKKYVDTYDYIVIDCPPAVESPVPQSALIISDLAIVPVVPSPPDIWAGRGIKILIEQIKDINHSLKACLVVNMAQPNTSLGKTSQEALANFGLPLIKTTLGLRTAYREAVVFGCTVQALEKGKAKQSIEEVESLTDEVLSYISNSNNTGEIA